MNYTVYDQDTGAVLRWGECPYWLLSRQAVAANEVAISGHYPADQWRWDGTQMVAVLPSLAELQDAKWTQMKAARAAALQAPLVTPYGTFDADPVSRDNIIQTAQLMQTQAQSFAPAAAPTVDFTLADNTVVTLAAGEMVNVALLLAAQIQAGYTRGREVRVAIYAATTAEEVAAIAW